MTRHDIEKFLELAKDATPGLWESDSTMSEGSYGVGDDTHEGFKAYEILAEVGGKVVTLCDSINSDVGEVHEEWDGNDDGDHLTAWDETAFKNFQFIAASKNTAPAIAKYALALEEENKRLAAALVVMFAAWDAKTTKDALSYIGLGHDVHFPCVAPPINTTEAAREVYESIRIHVNLNKEEG